VDLEVLQELSAVIEDRRKHPKPKSYVNKMMSSGLEDILKKISEEVTELTISVGGSDKEAIVHETADVIFHLMILLAYKRISLADVLDELRKRRTKR